MLDRGVSRGLRWGLVCCLTALVVLAAAGTAQASGSLRASPFVEGGSAPTITSMSAHEAWSDGGGKIWVYGSGLSEITSVQVGDQAAEFEEWGPEEMRVEIPREDKAAEEAGGKVRVSVTTIDGTDEPDPAGEDMLTYIPPVAPKVAHVEPAKGTQAGGTKVTIKGQGFEEPGGEEPIFGVWFGSKRATSYTVESATELVAVSPAHEGEGAVHVMVETREGESPLTTADKFEYVHPIVERVLPSEGLPAGGNTVEIQGANLEGAEEVKFGTQNATITEDRPFRIEVKAPAGSGTVDVTVKNSYGTSATGVKYSYVTPPAPTVTSISPSSGDGKGGTEVTLKGTGFSTAEAVKFGAATASIVKAVSASEMVVSAPAGSGTVDVTVIGPGGTSATSEADRYRYLGAPVVTGVSPSATREKTFHLVTITGTGLGSATHVKFGSVGSASGIEVVSDTKIRVTSPAEPAGTVDVTVESPHGTSATSAADRFTYLPPPVVTGVSPSSGPDYGGNTVTVTGSGFLQVEAIVIGFNEKASFKVESEHEIAVTLPSSQPDHTVDLLVRTLAGTSEEVPADRYTFLPAPSVSGLTPSIGSKAGGTEVQINGRNLEHATGVQFAGTPASFEETEHGLVATSPPGTGTVDVTVTTAEGTSPVVAGDRFEYVDPPVISGISPERVDTGGNASVPITISGQGLGEATVTVPTWTGAGMVEQQLKVKEDTADSLVVEMGWSNSPGVAQLTVHAPGGTASADFEFVPTPETYPEFGNCAKLATAQGAFKNSKCALFSPGDHGKYEFTPGLGSGAVTFSGGSMTFQGPRPLTCTGVSGTGTPASSSQIADVLLSFSGCTMGELGSCSNTGTSGEVQTQPLNAYLAWTNKKQSSMKEPAFALVPQAVVGVLEEFLYPSAIAHFVCGSHGVTLTGIAVTPVKPAKAKPSLPFVFATKKGKPTAVRTYWAPSAAYSAIGELDSVEGSTGDAPLIGTLAITAGGPLGVTPLL